MCTLYHRYQMGSVIPLLLFTAESWNNALHCMSLCIVLDRADEVVLIGTEHPCRTRLLRLSPEFLRVWLRLKGYNLGLEAETNNLLMQFYRLSFLFLWWLSCKISRLLSYRADSHLRIFSVVQNIPMKLSLGCLQSEASSGPCPFAID